MEIKMPEQKKMHHIADVQEKKKKIIQRSIGAFSSLV
jgi:hypothetical protein